MITSPGQESGGLPIFAPDRLPLLVGDVRRPAAAGPRRRRAAGGADHRRRERHRGACPGAATVVLGVDRAGVLAELLLGVDPHAHVGPVDVDPLHAAAVAVRVVAHLSLDERLVDRGDVGGPERGPLDLELALDLAGAGERRRVRRGLRLRPQDRGLADLEPHHRQGQDREHQHDEPRHDLPVLPCGAGTQAHGPASLALARPGTHGPEVSTCGWDLPGRSWESYPRCR